MVPIVLAGPLLSVSPSSGCPPLSDRVKHGFEPGDLAPVVMDVDGDGKPDTITPRLTVTQYRDQKGKLRQANWIVFDLKTSRGHRLPSFFKYRYGTDRIAYWVWAMVCKDNPNGRGDLVFYSGDDTSDETIVLTLQGQRYRVASSKLRDNEGRDLKGH